MVEPRTIGTRKSETVVDDAEESSEVLVGQQVILKLNTHHRVLVTKLLNALFTIEQRLLKFSCQCTLVVRGTTDISPVTTLNILFSNLFNPCVCLP